MSATYTLLGLLDSGPNYGYELKKAYDQLFGKDKPLAYGQIYATLGRLKRGGNIAESLPDTLSGGPERVRYEITSKGRGELDSWLATPEQPAPYLQATMYVKTVLALMKDGPAAEYLDEQRHMHIERMRELTKLRRESAMSEMLLIDHALFHLEADLRWIDLTSSRLTKLKEELCQKI